MKSPLWKNNKMNPPARFRRLIYEERIFMEGKLAALNK